MKRRWKIGTALAFVGLAGFLVWAFLSDPTRGVAIRFLGYETNEIQSGRHWMTTNTSGIDARFCVTNGSKRGISCDAYEGIPLFEIETKTNGRWVRPPRSTVGAILSFRSMVLPPAGNFCFTVPVPDLRQPLRLTLPYSTNAAAPGLWGMDGRGFERFSFLPEAAANTLFARLRRRVAARFGWNKGPPSIAITIQD